MPGTVSSYRLQRGPCLGPWWLLLTTIFILPKLFRWGLCWRQRCRKNCVRLSFDRPGGWLRFPAGPCHAVEPQRLALWDFKLQKNKKNPNLFFRSPTESWAKFNLGASSGFSGRSHTSTQGGPHHRSGIKSANVIPPLLRSGSAPDEFNGAALFPNRIGDFSNFSPWPSARPPTRPVPRSPGALGRGSKTAATVNSLSAVKDFS